MTVAECNVINGRSESPLPAALAAVSSPIQIDQWVAGLALHPDCQFAQYICTGLSQGFRIGFQRGRLLRSSRRNIGSANAKADVVDAYLGGEVQARRWSVLRRKISYAA